MEEKIERIWVIRLLNRITHAACWKGKDKAGCGWQWNCRCEQEQLFPFGDYSKKGEGSASCFHSEGSAGVMDNAHLCQWGQQRIG